MKAIPFFLATTFAAALFSACGDDDKKPADTADTTDTTDTADTADSAADSDSAQDTDTTPGDPGIMLRTSMSAKVGVMLDELPEGAYRDGVVAALIGKDDAFWVARAHEQLELTQYRLTFRAYFYEESEGKGALNLPPPEVWNISIDGAATRQTIDGHDYVAVGYTLTSAVLADNETPIQSDQAFAAIGGTVSEEFVLPVDPELVFQRSGFACLDEAEFPPHSVDGENVPTYYDQECTAVEDLPPGERCHETEQVTEDCIDALKAHIGSVTATLTFERVPWVEEEAATFRVGEWTSTEGVDVVPVAEALAHNYIVYKYIGEDDCAVVEQCVGGTGWRRLLRFDAFLKNTGQADMEIGDVDYFIESTEGDTTLLGRHNIFEYSACHNHYHFKYYGLFGLDVGAENVEGSKRAFCLETGTRHFNNENTPTITAYSGCHFQGLTHGWGDEYGANLDCQWYDITEVDTSGGPAPANISFVANPDGFLCEGNPVLDGNGNLTFEPTDFKTDEGEPVDRPVCDYISDWDKNNKAEYPTTIPQVGGLMTEPCTRGQYGPLRDCGFSVGPKVGAGALDQCTADAAHSVVCTNDGTSPVTVRVCEASKVLGSGVACVYRDALASQVVLPGETTGLTFPCPAGRSATEPGGYYALYSSHLGDEAGPVAGLSCITTP